MNTTDQISSGILGILTTDGLGGFADEAAGIIFLMMLATTLIGGIIAFNARQLIHAVQGLAVCFIGVAAIYYYLNSPFLAMMPKGPLNTLGGPCFLSSSGAASKMPKVNMGDMKLIGSKLLTTYSMVFELVSIVLLIAIIGSLVIGRKGRSK